MVALLLDLRLQDSSQSQTRLPLIPLQVLHDYPLVNQVGIECGAGPHNFNQVRATFNGSRRLRAIQLTAKSRYRCRDPRTLLAVAVRGLSHFSTLRDGNIRSRPLTSKSGVFHFTNNVHTVDDFAEYNMLVVQERGRNGANEELAAVGIRPGILLESISSAVNKHYTEDVRPYSRCRDRHASA